MADKIVTQVNLQYTNGLYTASINPGVIRSDQTAAGHVGGIQNVGTSAENLEVGDVSTPGLLSIRNLDDTNFVAIGKDVSASFEEFARLKPGDPPFLIRVGGSVTLQLKADTAACDVQYLLLED